MGHPRAAVLMGYLAERGLGMARDDEAAARWYARGAALEDPDALFALGVMARTERGGLEASEAEDFLLRAADAGRADARYELAVTFLDPAADAPDPERGEALLRQAAADGVPAAQRDLALLLLEQEGDAADLAAALTWLEVAAEQDAEAAYAFGLLLAEGDRVARDAERAESYLRQAAEDGLSAAAADLGWLLYHDDQTDAREEATAWLAQAAEGGDGEGRFRYAWALTETAFLDWREGRSVSRDDVETAYRNLLLAEADSLAETGVLDDHRTRLRTILEEVLPPEERAALEEEMGLSPPG